MNDRELVFHGLAIKRHSTPEMVAGLLGLPVPRVTTVLEAARGSLRVVEARGAYSLAPLARVALEAGYGLAFGELRADPGFIAPYETFETINRTLKAIITDWQTMLVRDERVPNDHSDDAYDTRIIDRLGALHEQIEPVLRALAARLARLDVYRGKLTQALELAEDGDIAWVSDIRRESYHTVWFELHEDLLRIMGRQRDD